MTLPPAKRQRKIILSDDDEEPVVKTRRAPARLSSARKATLADRIAANQKVTPAEAWSQSTPRPSPKSSPEKGKKRAIIKEREGRSLHTFFAKATEEQRWARKDKTASISVKDGEANDAIEDDSLDEALVDWAEADGNENEVLDRRKVLASRLRNNGFNARHGLRAPTKFTKPPKLAPSEERGRSSSSTDHVSRPWAERFAPKVLGELAVHKKKVADVQNWFTAVLNGRDRHRLLVLKGPAGSGKTTTVSLLSKAMQFAISEWRSPTVVDSGKSSFSSQFDDFLNRGGIFGALDLSDGMLESKSPDGLHQPDDQRRILLVEEFPSTMTLSSSALASFRNILLQYLAVAVPSRTAALGHSNSHVTAHPPIVLVISESLLTSGTASTDSFTAHRLLGPEICNHPYATILEFNPVAPTLLTKALELAIKKEAGTSKRRRIPGPAVLKRLSELGDIRSAVNGLEFLCIRGDTGSDWGGTTAAKAKRSAQSGSNLTAMEKDSLELITQREATLGIFHTVGKVVWNKREDPRIADAKAEPTPQPPSHLPACVRPKIAQVETDELLKEIGTDIMTFTAALHENYALSTNGRRFAESASDCMDLLSDSDLLSPGSRQITPSSYSSRASLGASMQLSGIDVLRQNEISFHVAVRGVLFSLPCPVSRAAYPNGRKGDSYKMFYPASLKIWKPTEEIYDLLSLEMSRLLALGSDGARTSISTGARTDGVESWKSKSRSFRPDPSQTTTSSEDMPSRVWTTRDELLLDRLPYTTRTASGSDKINQGIKKITQLDGVHLSNNDEEADLDASPEGALDFSAADETTDRLATSPQKRAAFDRKRDMDASAAAAAGAAKIVLDPTTEAQMEKLYISEDDIEDD